MKENAMKHASRTHSISWLQQEYKSGRLVLRPPFQRKPVWGDKQRNYLIESILMDIPIPEMYVQVTHAEDDAEEFGVVDGQQRLRTILQFVGVERLEDQTGEDINRFALTELPVTSPYKDETLNDLTAERRTQFFTYELSFRFLYTEDRREVEEVFKRLNKFTMPLKPQELRNATYHGAFAKLSEQLADDEYWAVNRIIGPAAIRRMADIEMMSDLLIGLLHGPQGGSARIIDQYYEEYEQYEDEFPGEPKVRRQFSDTLGLTQRLFPNISELPRWANKADFYSLFIGLGSLLKDNEITKASERALARELIEFAAAVDRQLGTPSTRITLEKKNVDIRDYARAVEKGSNDRARRVDRHKALLHVMQPFFKQKKMLTATAG
jgi:hypothetical protein